VDNVEQFTYGIEDTPAATILVLRGKIDCTQSNLLYEAIDQACQASDKGIVIDLSEVPYVDSSALGVLVATRSRLSRASRPLKLCGLDSMVNRVFQASRLDRIFDIHPTRQEALKT
jgi:anti-sigma B factor antagonist